MNLSRREFTRVLGAGAVAMGAGAAPDARQRQPQRASPSTVDFELEIRGGYVWVMEVTGKDSKGNDLGTVEVGPIKHPPEKDSDLSIFQQHDLLLVVREGIAKQELDPMEAPTTLPWNLNGAVVKFSATSAASTDPVALPQKTSAGSNYGRDRLPDLINQAKLSVPNSMPERKKAWRDELDGRVVLAGGELQVSQPSVPADYAKLGFGKPKNVDSDADVSDTLRYTLSSHTAEVFLLIDDKPAIKLTPRQGGSAIRAVITPTVVPLHSYPAGNPITHFAMFYRLLRNPPPLADRRVPHASVLRTPGIFCPPGAYMID